MSIVRESPSYYVWKELNSPAAISAHWDADSVTTAPRFTLTVTPNQIENLPYYPLRDYRVVWQVSDETGKLVTRGEQQFANIEKPQVINGQVQSAVDARLLKLKVTLLRPGNTVAAEKSVDWRSDDAAEAAGSSASQQTMAH